jgi:hypothetical protein
MLNIVEKFPKFMLLALMCWLPACSFGSPESASVSVIELRVLWKNYMDSKVTTQGYLSQNGPFYYLYNSREDALTKNIWNAVPVANSWVGADGSVQECLNKYIRLEGTFGEISVDNEPTTKGIFGIESMLAISLDSGEAHLAACKEVRAFAP